VLVFTRKVGEAIVIGDGIEIRVLRAGRDGVKLGVSAPVDVTVHRREIYELIRKANASAAASPIEVAGLVDRVRARFGKGKSSKGRTT
jgi:carbon storage regulator